MKLTDKAVQAAKPKKDKPYKLFDGGGLYLEVLPSGSKSWRLKYRVDGKEKRVAFGLYPVVSLKDARERAFEAKKLLVDGADPSAAKKAAKAAAAAQVAQVVRTFKDVAAELIKQKELRCTTEYVDNYKRSLELHIYPAFGDKSIADVTGRDVVTACEAASKSGTYIAHKLAQRVGEVFDLSVLHGDREYNPVSKATHKSLKPHKERSFAAISADDLPAFYKSFASYRGFPLTKLMLDFTLHTFLRTIEVRRLEWGMIDFEKRIIEIPSGAEHNRKNAPVVPISSHVLRVIEKARAITGDAQLVFPMFRNHNATASENVLLQALKSMGWKGDMTGHGFRSLARTTLEEEGGFHADVCELQLGHTIARNETEAAYRRVKFIDERTRMMQWWSDYLEEIRKSVAE